MVFSFKRKMNTLLIAGCLPRSAAQHCVYCLLCFRYQGPLLKAELFEQEIEKGPTSVEFTKLVDWLTKELGEFYGIDDCVNAITSEFLLRHQNMFSK